MEINLVVLKRQHVEEGRYKACYSPTQHRSQYLKWTDLPEIKFKTTLKEIVNESLIIFLNNKGTLQNSSLARGKVKSQRELMILIGFVFESSCYFQT